MSFRMQAGHNKGRACVIWCPHNAIPRGSLYLWSDFGGSTYESTLEEGFWPLGMVIEYEGSLYVVCGSGRFWLEQKRQGFPLGVEYPPQELRKLNGKNYCGKTFTILTVPADGGRVADIQGVSTYAR